MDNKTSSHIIGESIAKLYFESTGHYVYTNNSGKAEFDLVVSKDKELFSVEVKTVSSPQASTKGTYYEVQLKSVRSNKTDNVIHKFNGSAIDFLVVVNVGDYSLVVFDAAEITATSSMRIYADAFKNIGTLAESA